MSYFDRISTGAKKKNLSENWEGLPWTENLWEIVESLTNRLLNKYKSLIFNPPYRKNWNLAKLT